MNDERAKLESVMPFFIVDDIRESVEFYQSKLGFELELLIPADDPFYAIVRRDRVQFSLKKITDEIHPAPNHARHEWARWDAFVHTSSPTELFEEYETNGVPIHQPLADAEGLRAFEIKDNSGYVLCFGHPIE